MNKRIVCFVLGAMLLALSFRADAQQPGKVPRIGFLTTGSASDPRNALSMDTLRQALRDLGYVEGKTSTLSTDILRGNLNNCQA
jgi:hypothetical protein